MPSQSTSNTCITVYLARPAPGLTVNAHWCITRSKFLETSRLWYYVDELAWLISCNCGYPLPRPLHPLARFARFRNFLIWYGQSGYFKRNPQNSCPFIIIFHIWCYSNSHPIWTKAYINMNNLKITQCHCDVSTVKCIAVFFKALNPMRERVATVAACFLYFQTRQIRNDKNRSLPGVSAVFTVPQEWSRFKTKSCFTISNLNSSARDTFPVQLINLTI